MEREQCSQDENRNLKERAHADGFLLHSYPVSRERKKVKLVAYRVRPIDEDQITVN